MRPIIITGEIFNSDKIFGLSRYGFEVVKGIDDILTRENRKLDVRLCYPNDESINVGGLKSIRTVPLIREKHYRLGTLRNYINESHGISCNFANELQLYKNGIVCIHDMRPLDTKGSFDTRCSYKYIFRLRLSIKIMHSTVVTVSEYQRNRISALCRIPKDKIYVIGNGWEHILKIDSDELIFDKLSDVKKEQYFYTLGSVAKHKNLKWIYEVAKRNPDKTFVIAGDINKNAWGTDTDDYNLQNIIFCGYVSDEENIALMKNCKAFLFPSLYEGFGIPPLEALALGRKIILSNSTCLPEIFEDTAVYFDPYDYNVNLDALLNEPVGSPNKVLEKYTWKNSAYAWLEFFEKEIEEREKR